MKDEFIEVTQAVFENKLETIETNKNFNMEPDGENVINYFIGKTWFGYKIFDFKKWNYVYFINKKFMKEEI